MIDETDFYKILFTLSILTIKIFIDKFITKYGNMNIYIFILHCLNKVYKTIYK